MDFEPSKPIKCMKCKDTGIVKDPDGRVHVCWDCLNSGRLDVHSKDLPESKFRW